MNRLAEALDALFAELRKTLDLRFLVVYSIAVALIVVLLAFAEALR